MSKKVKDGGSVPKKDEPKKDEKRAPAPAESPAAPQAHTSKVMTKEDAGVSMTLPVLAAVKGKTSKLFVKGLPEDATGDDVFLLFLP